MFAPSPAVASPDLFTLLYVSEFTSADAGAIARLCEQSRHNNERDDITGLLVFDGRAFCQFIEGPRAAIERLYERLERDPRHTRIRMLQASSSNGARRFPSWRLGYAYSADPAAIERLHGSHGGAALAAFESFVPGLDPGE